MPVSRKRKNHTKKLAARAQRHRALDNKIKKYRSEMMASIMAASKQYEEQQKAAEVLPTENVASDDTSNEVEVRIASQSEVETVSGEETVAAE